MFADCVFVPINKRSFELFMCLDHDNGNALQSLYIIHFVF